MRIPEELQAPTESTSSARALSDNELLTAIGEEVDLASNARQERARNGEQALDYFYGKLPAPPSDDDAEMGMSDVVSTDVQDAVYAVCAEMLPAFGGASPVEFEPLGPQDEQRADLETQATNHVANNCGIYLALVNSVQDSMLRRAGVVKTYWDVRHEVVYEDHKGIPVQMLPQALAPTVPGERVEAASGVIDETTGTATTCVKRCRLKSEPRIDAVPLDEFLISANLATPNVNEARFVAHQRPVTRSELVELGVETEVVDALDEYASMASRSARERGYADTQLRTGHESTEYVMVTESYYCIDFDGDGIAERRRVITAGGADGTDELLLNDPWDEQPFAVGIGYFGVYTWDGVSLFDRLKGIQDAKTWLIRETLNTARRAMRQRIGIVENDANWDDALTSQLGGVVRMKTPKGLVPVPDVQIPAAVLQVLEYLDGLRKDKGGGAVDATASAQVLGQGGDWSLERLMAATEQINAMVAKNLVETLVKPIYRKLHKLLRQYRRDPIMVPGTAGWKAAEPAKWSPRYEMAPTMGMSVGERTVRLGALQAVLQQQAQDAKAGLVGILSDAKGAYQARLDMARLAGLPSPEQYFVEYRRR